MNRLASSKNVSSSLMSSALWSVDQRLDSLQELTDEQQLRLTDVLDRWLSALEHGTPLAQDKLLAEHPDLAETLKTYFHSLADLHEMAAGFGGGDVADQDHEEAATDGEKRIGDFELRHELGRGGMGVVYEARQISLDRLVAIKILPFASVLDSRQIARFKHEAQAAAQLHHEHIVPVFAIGVERGVHYYAMQLVNGQSLDQFITGVKEQRASQRLRPLSREHFENVARLGLQAAEALHAAHEYGVVHRDIKPSNLLVEPIGEHQKLWVTDFGLARMQREVSLTRTGDLIGTLRYMSPEQAAGKSVVDHRTDIYSLGATLYELATLSPAYSDDQSAIVLRQIESQDPTPPQQLRPEMPADLANIIRTAMSRNRDDRYSTAADFAADLRRFLAGEPTAAKAPSRIDRITRWGQRHARLVALTASLLLIAVLGLSIGTFLVVREQQRANANLARAQQSARDAREVLDRFGRQLSERLAHVAGAEDVRRELLLAASDYYRRFIADAQSDPALQTELAIVYGRLATLLDEVGTPDEAVAAHERAVNYLQNAAKNNAANETQQRLAIAQNNYALALLRADRHDLAKAQLQAAIDSQQKLGSQSPANRQFTAELAASYSNLGLVQQAAGDAAAEAAFQQAVDKLQSLVAAQTDSKTHAQSLAAALNNLASVHAKQNPRRAAELHQQALELQQQVAIAQPTNHQLQRELALTHHNLAVNFSRLQQFAEAAQECRQAIVIQTELVREFPAQQIYQRDLAISFNNQGLAQSRQKQAAAASESFQAAAKLQEELLRHSPADVNLQSSYGSTLSNWGVARSQEDDLPGAAAKFEQAMAAQQRASMLAPESARIRELLQKHQSLLTAVQQKMSSLHASAAE